MVIAAISIAVQIINQSFYFILALVTTIMSYNKTVATKLSSLLLRTVKSHHQGNPGALLVRMATTSSTTTTTTTTTIARALATAASSKQHQQHQQQQQGFRSASSSAAPAYEEDSEEATTTTKHEHHHHDHDHDHDDHDEHPSTKDHSNCNLCGATACPKHAQFYTGQGQPFDAFAVLNMDRKFDLSLTELKGKYHKLMDEYHPDRHHSSTTTRNTNIDTIELQKVASQITQAYQMLQNPHSRATHLLSLLGLFPEDDGESVILKASASSGLLMEIMELREQIEEASSDDDLQQLRDQNAKNMQEVCTQLSQSLDASTFDASEQVNLDQALEFTVKLQYYHRIEETIREKIQN